MRLKDKKIRILIAIPNLYGGTGVFCRNLAKGLKKYFPHKYEIILLIFDNTGLLEKDKEIFDSIYSKNKYPHKDIRRIIEFFLYIQWVKKILKNLNPDIVLSIGTYLNIIMSLIIKKNKLILTEHDVPSVRLNYSSYKYIIKLIMKFLYRDKLVIGVSKKVKEDLKKNFKVKNAKFIYNGIDKEEIYILSEEAINEDIINKPYIISIGRLTTQKDFLTLIKAYSITLNKNKEIKENLIIIGDGEDKQKILKLIRELNLSDRVFLLGYKHNPYPYLKKAKLFILSSIWEGYGIALVEALVLGIPVISTNWLGASEILDNGKYGILVPSKDHKKMGEEIFNLLNHPEMLEVLKKKSRERGDFFSLQRMVNSYNEVFENLKYGKN